MSTSRRRWLQGVSVAAGALGVGLYATRSPRSREDVLTIRFSHVVAEDTPKGKAARLFREMVLAESGGRVRVDVHPNSSLYRDHEELEALQFGSVEIVAPSMAKLAPLGLRDFELFDLPFLFDSYEALHRITNGPVGHRLLGGLASAGLRGLAFWDNGFKHMSAQRPLLDVDSFSGLRMRVQDSGVLQSQMRALGAVPDPMALSDVYAALRAGVVDGAENPPSNFLTQGLYKVQRYLTLSGHGYLGYVVLVSERFWSGLPRQTRNLLQSALARATAYANEIAQSENEQALARIRALGSTTVLELPPEMRRRWMKALASTHAEFRARGGASLLEAVHLALGTRPLA